MADRNFHFHISGFIVDAASFDDNARLEITAISAAAGDGVDINGLTWADLEALHKQIGRALGKHD